MKIRQFEIWIADLNPKSGTESGKTRPVLIIQTNLLNQVPHPSTFICSITTHVKTKGRGFKNIPGKRCCKSPSGL